MSESQNTSKPDALARLSGRLLSPPGGRGRLAVFCFHQVLDALDPLRRGEPDTVLFERDADVIASVFNVLSLPDAIERMQAGTLPAKAASITFDDGYANNYSNAAPILESRGLTATFFITGGAIENGIMWNDLVIESVARRKSDFDTAAIAALDGDEIQELPDDRKVRTILDKLKYLPLDQRLDAATALYEANVGGEPPRLMMRPEQIADLAARRFDIGAHTINHPILKQLSPDESRKEIEHSRDWVAAVTGRVPESFAYPNGRPGVDFDDRTCKQVAHAGYSLAVSTEWGVASRKDDRFGVPRVGPWWRQGYSLASGFAKIYLRSYL